MLKNLWKNLNEGCALLGYIIEKCSGMVHEEYVQKYVLAPLGIEKRASSYKRPENCSDRKY